MKFSKAKDVVSNVHAVEKVKKARRLVPAPVSRSASRTLLKTQKNAPSILFGVGVVGVVATAVLTARATLRVDEILDDVQVTKEKFQLALVEKENYTQKDVDHDMTLLYVKTAVRFTKLYAPALIAGSLSIAALTGSHNMLNRRNAAVTAAYAAVEKSYADYRRRVRDELGEDKDREFRHGVETLTEIEETPNGPKKHKKKGPKEPGDFAVFFGPENQNWCKSPELNLLFLRNVQGWCNDRLRTRGHVFLNDVFDDLGMERTRAGSQVGWVHGKNPDGTDKYVDFGVWSDDALDKFHDFATGREDCILLDFNVDPGFINNKI